MMNPFATDLAVLHGQRSRRGPRACVALLGVAALTFALSCDPPKAPPSTALDAASKAQAGAAAAGVAAPAGARQDTATPTSGSVQIEDRIVKACGDLPTAHFAFDSTEIQADAGVALDALARCFVTGPLKGAKGMKLIGYADPRGEREYNFGLGQKRAGSVGSYLSKKGVDKSRLETSSKGDLEATGTDEEGWAKDRKVSVLLSD